jgi:hypothetical protein
MPGEENESEYFSKWILDWLTRVGAIAAVLVPIIAQFFPDQDAQRLAYAAAILLLGGSAAIYWYQRRRNARLAIAEPPEQLAPTAALRGLLPFEEGDELHGRAHDEQLLYTLITSSTFRFGVLWGESGCGKTSLLRAGVVPMLRQHGFLPLYIGKPTKEPRMAIRAALKKETGGTAAEPREDLKKLFSAAVPKGKTIVVILDQFEEFFLINRTPRSRASFIKWLGDWVADPDLPVVFLLSIRADFFAQLQNLAPDIPEPTSPRTTYELQNFDVEQAKQTLSAAAKADAIQFEPTLIDAVVSDLETDGFIRPAELQIVGTRLKRKNILNLNKYEVVGRARGILSSYIGEEIKQSANAEVARLILRLMAVDVVETKSPTDLSLDDVMRGVSGVPAQEAGANTAVQPEQVKGILQQFVAARILIHTEEDKYNLIHDYLATYVRAATEGVETNVERADRLLRRYVAEYKEDPKTRIPFRHVRRIQKYASADVKSGEQAQRLLRKSARAFYATVGSVLVVPLSVLGLYLFLASSYYLSLEAQVGNVAGPAPSDRHIVVLSGYPQLEIVPGFDHVIVQTDFTESDLATSYRDEIIGEQVTGFWFQKEHGYERWGGQLITGLAPPVQARALQWLGQPERAVEVLTRVINDSTTDITIDRAEVVQAIALLAQHHPEVVTGEVIEALQAILTDRTVNPDLRGAVAGSIAQLGQSNPEVVTSEVIEALHTILTDRTATPGLRGAVAGALLQLAQDSSQIITSEITDILLALLKGANDSIGRNVGAYGLFHLAVADPSQQQWIRNEADKLRQQPQLHLQIAGSKVLEMLVIGNLVQDAGTHPERVPHIKLTLERLHSITESPYSSEEHIDFAASVALEEIEQIAKEKK